MQTLYKRNKKINSRSQKIPLISDILTKIFVKRIIKKIDKLEYEINNSNYWGEWEHEILYKKNNDSYLGETLFSKKEKVRDLKRKLLNNKRDLSKVKLDFKNFKSLCPKSTTLLLHRGVTITASVSQLNEFLEVFEYYRYYYNGDDYFYFKLFNIKYALDESELTINNEQLNKNGQGDE